MESVPSRSNPPLGSSANPTQPAKSSCMVGQEGRMLWFCADCREFHKTSHTVTAEEAGTDPDPGDGHSSSGYARNH
jgi:hypothetical protein